MTVGEKIQYYRKKIGLSQEELGQKMLLSRQTISLWEMDKTLPTVDNLLRLKEIFSVSVDELLSENEPKEQSESEPAEAPKESYSFVYDKSDISAFFDKQRRAFINRTVLIAVAAVIMILSSLGVSPWLTWVYILFIISGCIFHAKSYANFKKIQCYFESKIIGALYSYDVYDGYFILNISHGGDVKRMMKIYFGDIESAEKTEKHIIFGVGGQAYIIKREALAVDSIFYPLCDEVSKKMANSRKNPEARLKTVSNLLFIFSIVTIFFALASLAIMSRKSYPFHMVQNMWVFYLFIPIPIASIVFGFHLKKRGYRYKKNVIIGFIMAILLFIYGSFSFIFANEYSHDETLAKETEELLSIDLPEYYRIDTKDFSGYTQSSSYGHIYTVSNIYFDEAAVREFEESLEDDAKWLAYIPSSLSGITSYYCEVSGGKNYYIVYNTDTAEFNKLPDESGEFTFINVIYNTESNTMKIVKYKREYMK